MASSTTNLGLIKPAGNEKIRIAQINQNSDTIDNAIGAVGSTSLQAQVSAIEDGIAIVANGDSHVAITAGQFVYVRNNTHNLAEGLYVASANVGANASITSSNMTADASGGLNALNAKIESKTWTPTANDTLLGYILNTIGITNLPKTFTKNGDAVVSDAPFGSEEYVVTLTGNNTRVHVEVTKYNAGTDEVPYTYQRDIFNGAWRRDSWVSLNANITIKANIYTYNLDSNATVYINHNGGVLVFTDRGGMWTEGNATRALTEIAASSAVTVTRVTKNKLQATSSYNYATTIYVIGNDIISFSNS